MAAEKLKFRPDCQGLILVGVVWLLLLCSVIAVSVRANSASHRSWHLLNKSTVHIENALISGATLGILQLQQPRWLEGFSSPVELPLEKVGNVDLRIILSRESGRIDLMNAPVSLIRDGLIAAGFSASNAASLADQLNHNRQQGRRMQSLGEVLLLVDAEALPLSPCLYNYFTYLSGRVKPDWNHSTAAMVRQIVDNNAADLSIQNHHQPANQISRLGWSSESFEVFRIKVIAENRSAQLLVWVRLTGRIDRSLQILSVIRSQVCQVEIARYVNFPAAVAIKQTTVKS